MWTLQTGSPWFFPKPHIGLEASCNIRHCQITTREAVGLSALSKIYYAQSSNYGGRESGQFQQCSEEPLLIVLMPFCYWGLPPPNLNLIFKTGLAPEFLGSFLVVPLPLAVYATAVLLAVEVMLAGELPPFGPTTAEVLKEEFHTYFFANPFPNLFYSRLVLIRTY